MMDDGGKAPLLSSQDPYYAVRDAVDDSVRTLRVKFDSWKGLLQSVDTATSVEFKTLHEELKKELTKMGEMLRKVRGSVDGVERNRAKFSHIDDKELASRKGALEKIDAVSLRAVVVVVLLLLLCWWWCAAIHAPLLFSLDLRRL